MTEPQPGTVGHEAMLDQSDAAVTDLARRITRMVDQGTWPPKPKGGK